MPNLKHIDIPVPCSRKEWEQMDPNNEGRFCDQCNKTVIDLTGLTDQQVIDIVSGSTRVCGRLESSQISSINDMLNREAVTMPRNIWKRIAVAATVVWSLSFLKAEAQFKPATVQLPAINGDNPTNTPADTVTYRIITGRIIGEKDSLPVIGAVVSVEKIAVASNLKGDFKIRVPLTAKKMTVSCIGYKTQIVQINERSEYRILVADGSHFMGEVDITKHPVKAANK